LLPRERACLHVVQVVFDVEECLLDKLIAAKIKYVFLLAK
jgi:hypothetical protein